MRKSVRAFEILLLVSMKLLFKFRSRMETTFLLFNPSSIRIVCYFASWLGMAGVVILFRTHPTLFAWLGCPVFFFTVSALILKFRRLFIRQWNTPTLHGPGLYTNSPVLMELGFAEMMLLGFGNDRSLGIFFRKNDIWEWSRAFMIANAKA